MLVVALMGLTGCHQQDTPADKLGVFVSILPQAEWVTAIGGDKVEVSVMIPPGASPHVYEPTASQMKTLSRAKIYAAVGSGIEFEISFLEELLEINPDVLLVDCSQGVDLIEMDAGEHDYDYASEHQHAYDPHIWLSLVNAEIMATNIYDGMAAADPANQSYYRQNLERYLGELNEMHNDFQEGFAPLNNRVFIMQHPSMGYFANDYNLIQIAAEEGGSDATIQSMIRTIEQAKQNNVKVIFVSPQFPASVAEAVAQEINGIVEPLDSLAGNYKENMNHIFNIMHEAMGGR